MKAEAWVFGFLAIFFGIVTPTYWFLAHELAGTVALALAGLLGLMVAVYFALLAKTHDRRPEDRTDGEVVDNAGLIGFFPPSSIWPFWAALTVSVMVLGPVFGWWLTLLGAGFGVWALCGWVYQYYRGDYKH